ncbi:unnamed protein product [Symbiodinium natans]|uniref:Uncharacterized protein n=1 Tax=Symbiodinium natans TaxID=878477 RepID=A0A812M6S0_9DINO|nr:unnamed protein product [Symbiodinium natans]
MLPPSTQGRAPPDLGLLSRQLAAEVAADRTLANRLEQEVGPLELRVHQAQEDLSLSRMQAKDAFDIQQRMTDLERSLEGQIHAAKEQLLRLGEERRQLTELFCSGAVDKERASSSRQLLEQVLDEEARALEETRAANVFLEESCRGLLQQLSFYESERASLSREVEDETAAQDSHEQAAHHAHARTFTALSGRPDPRSRPGV